MFASTIQDVNNFSSAYSGAGCSAGSNKYKLIQYEDPSIEPPVWLNNTFVFWQFHYDTSASFRNLFGEWVDNSVGSWVSTTYSYSGGKQTISGFNA